MWYWVVFLCIVIVGGVQGQEETWDVQIDRQGILRGHKDDGDNIFIFSGVPYATVPTGRDKYKPPLPAPVWAETFDAVNPNIFCPQTSIPGLPTREDCLILNIAVPANRTTPLPVMVYAHGGAFMQGAAALSQFNNLARTQKIIIVTFNYRLGAPGFLCLGTEAVPGNAGLKDAVASLKWVKSNIAQFGGNPEDVTINGCSAGGGIVDILTLSPMAEGLFKKVITESGTAMGFTGPQVDPIQNAKIYASALGATNVDDIGELEDFYRNASYELLISQPFVLMNTTVMLFTPCIERNVGGEHFLTTSPHRILTNGDYSLYPMLYGYTNMDGLVFIDAFDDIKDDMSANFAKYLPSDLKFESAEEKEEIAQKVKEFYFDDKNVTTETILSFVDYYTDMFTYPMLEGLRLRRNAKQDVVYLYEYSFYDGSTEPVPHTDVRGADHCAQAEAVADQDLTNATQEYLQMRELMRNMWLNFMISGDPTPEGASLQWLPVATSRSPHMALKSNPTLSDTLIVKERVDFWGTIYDKHYREPTAPQTTADSETGGGAATAVINSVVLIVGSLFINYNLS